MEEMKKHAHAEAVGCIINCGQDGKTEILAYMYFKGEPLYPFGFGLSYTTFGYSDLRCSADSVNASGEITVSVDIRNTGKHADDEVVQMYVKHLSSAVERPIKELRGFERVSLQPSETRTVRLPLKGQDLT
jgi:beta-glucosidase